MTDYTKATGSSGTMMIRDTGSTVEFWLKAGSSTFAYDLSWGYYVNGAWSSYRNFSFQSGGAYQKLGSVSVTTDQTVGFRIADSGTSGLGGPTTFTIAVDRTSAPGTPGAWAIEQIFDTYVQGDTDSMPNGGLAIDQIQVRYDESSTAASPLYASDTNLDGYFNITGLARGTTYYFWVRTHNAKGWSPWSARTSAKTHNYPPAPSTPALSLATQTTVKTVFSSNGDGGSPVLEWELNYGLNATTPESVISSSGTLTLTGLQPGQKYYFRARGRNKYGWGAYSAISNVTLLAGAWVKVDGVWKRAVPYVRTGGVWKVAEAWAKIGGLWKVTG
jgi:hypothetical protein